MAGFFRFAGYVHGESATSLLIFRTATSWSLGSVRIPLIVGESRKPATQDRMNVLHLTLSFEPGGRRVAIENLAQGLREKGVSSFLCCTDSLGCDEDRLQQFFAAHAVVGRGELFDRSAAHKLAAFVAQHDIDIVHTHDAASLFTAALASQAIRQAPLITTFHRSLGFETEKLRGKLRNALALRSCERVITASSERRQHYVAENFVPAEKVMTIPLGIDTTRFVRNAEARARVRAELNIAADASVIGCMGHFGAEKGIDIVVDAFARVQATHERRDLHLLVVGKGTDERRTLLETIRANSPLPDRIHLLGYRTDAPAVMSALDVFAHGARIEAFGLVLIEALASSLPIVATRTGGIPDIISDDVGFLVGIDAPDEMALRLRELLDDKALLDRMADAAARRAGIDYAIPRYAERHAELYDELKAASKPSQLAS